MTYIDAATAEVGERVQFTGRAGEWFGIWIVNLLLTILTLGIFSAWAKVRKEQYFKRNTSIAGRSFDYHARGSQILIGRLIVIGAIIVLQLSLSLVPILGLLLLLGLVFLYPLLIIRAFRFNARVTSWSNVRFNFSGTYGDAFVTYILMPIGIALTLYTTLPFLSRRTTRFSIAGHSIGDHAFEFRSPIGPFYRAFLMGMAWLAVVGILTLGPAIATLIGLSDGSFEDDPGVIVAMAGGIYGFLFFGIIPAAIVYRAALRNAIFAGIELEGGHYLRSTITVPRLLWIVISNAVLTALTLGLMLPWTQIRLARYLSANTHVLANGSLERLSGRIEEEGSAIGDAYGDIEGIDMGLPA